MGEWSYLCVWAISMGMLSPLCSQQQHTEKVLMCNKWWNYKITHVFRARDDQSKARSINLIGMKSEPVESVLENRLFPIIARISHFVHRNVIFYTKPLLFNYMTTYSTAADTNKEICLPYLWFSCLFATPHPGYVAYCIDKSDFQNGTVAVPTLYFRVW